jgi:hypothetical protein
VNHPRDRSTQREFALDLGCRKALESPLNNKAPNFTIITLCPDNANISNWRIGDPKKHKFNIFTINFVLKNKPSFASGKGVRVGALVEFGPGLHASRVAAMVGLSESKTPDKLSFGCNFYSIRTNLGKFI